MLSTNPSAPVKLLRCLCFGFLPLLGYAGDPATETMEVAPAPPPPPRTSGPRKTGDFVFSLLPKTFQREPTLEMTVNTEFTDYGRLLRPATPQRPIYYVAVPAGFKPLGASVAGEHPPPQADMEKAMEKALAMNGFLPAEKTPGATAALVLVYYWGSHDNLDPETRRLFPELAAKYRLERAILVGGKNYAQAEGHVMEWGESILDRDATQDFLREQIADDVYYVVASAYDYASVAQGDRKLAWRTSMTVNTIGVSMRETLPPLIATAAPFFGRETTSPQIEVKKFPRKEKIDVGIPRVVDEAKPNNDAKFAGHKSGKP